MYEIKNKISKVAFFLSVIIVSLASNNLSADELTIPLPAITNNAVADRHADPRSSWNRDPRGSDRGNIDQGYYYWNQKYFSGRPNMRSQPYYQYYYDPKYYYDDLQDNGSVRYHPNN